MNEEAMLQALRECIKLKGREILSDKSKFRGAVQDLLPGYTLQKERNLLTIAVESFSVGKRLLEAPSEDSAREHFSLYLLKEIADNGLSQEAAAVVVRCFTAALDWNVSIASAESGPTPPPSSAGASGLCAHSRIDLSEFRCRDCAQTLYGLYNDNTYTPYEKLRKRERNGVLLSVSDSCAGTLVLPEHITALADDCLSEQNALQEVVLPASLRSIGRYAFDACPALKLLKVPDTVTSVGEGAFHGLKRVYYSGPAAGSPWGAKEHIKGGQPLSLSAQPAPQPQSVQVNLNAPPAPAAKPRQPLQPRASANAFIADKACDDFYYYGRSDLSAVTVPNSVTSIGDFAFSCCSLVSIDIPDGVACIGQGAFLKCGGLTGVTLPKSVSYIGANAFAGCSRLTEISVPASVTNIGAGAFSGLKRVYYDGPAAGSPWGAKEHIKAGSPSHPTPQPSFNNQQYSRPRPHTPPAPAGGGSGQPVQPNTPPKVLIADNADHNFAYERRDDFSKAVIPETAAQIGEFAFLNCRRLTEVVIPDGVICIGDNAFMGCSSLKEVVVPEGVEYIGSNAFNGCISLTRAVLPDTVKTIGRDAFRNCINLSFVSDPANLSSIGDDAFENCPKLQRLPTAKSWFQRFFD